MKIAFSLNTGYKLLSSYHALPDSYLVAKDVFAVETFECASGHVLIPEAYGSAFTEHVLNPTARVFEQLAQSISNGRFGQVLCSWKVRDDHHGLAILNRISRRQIERELAVTDSSTCRINQRIRCLKTYFLGSLGNEAFT